MLPVSMFRCLCSAPPHTAEAFDGPSTDFEPDSVDHVALSQPPTDGVAMPHRPAAFLQLRELTVPERVAARAALVARVEARDEAPEEEEDNTAAPGDKRGDARRGGGEREREKKRKAREG